MSRYNQNCLWIFAIVSFRVLIVIIFISIGFIKKLSQDQIVILRGVLDEVDYILSELPGGEGVRILVLLPHGRLVDGHTYPIASFFALNISRVYGIYYTIIIILEMEAPILLQDLGFALLIIFICGSGLPIFISLGTEFPHRRSLPISRRLIMRLSKVLLKFSPIIYGLPPVTPFRDLGLAVDDLPFIQAFNFGPVPLACTQILREEIGKLLKQLDIHSVGN